MCLNRDHFENQECQVVYNGKKLILAVSRKLEIKLSIKDWYSNQLFHLNNSTASIIFMTPERVAYLEYLSMSFSSEFAFILRSPPISYVSNIYYLPFTGVVWICSILLVILCTLIVALTVKFHMYPDEGTEKMTASDYIIFAIASTCQMGSDYLTKVLSTRISMVNNIY